MCVCVCGVILTLGGSVDTISAYKRSSRSSCDDFISAHCSISSVYKYDTRDAYFASCLLLKNGGTTPTEMFPINSQYSVRVPVQNHFVRCAKVWGPESVGGREKNTGITLQKQKTGVRLDSTDDRHEQSESKRLYRFGNFLEQETNAHSRQTAAAKLWMQRILLSHALVSRLCKIAQDLRTAALLFSCLTLCLYLGIVSEKWVPHGKHTTKRLAVGSRSSS